ncbi:MAG: DUF1559 domain-containing protein [Planctomycetota bacterium]
MASRLSRVSDAWSEGVRWRARRQRDEQRRPAANGLTLIELLVVLAIVAMLIGLLLPAVLAARESARRMQCTSRLRQQAFAILNYVEFQGRYPTGGWGEAWVGHAERGHGRRQPGGWAFLILPYLEQRELYELDLLVDADERPSARAWRAEQAVEVFVCPSRRETVAWPTVDSFPNAPGVPRPHLRQPRGSETIAVAARADYAMNAGTLFVTPFAGPESIEQGDDPDYLWPRYSSFDGVGHLRSEVRPAEVTDGLSKTYLIGEKWLAPKHYHDGVALGDNETLYSGYSSDLCRFTRSDLTPMRDSNNASIRLGDLRFGSAHPGSMSMAQCDGTVRVVSYAIDPLVHAEEGTRSPPSFSLKDR